jgi:hypothetical protein
MTTADTDRMLIEAQMPQFDAVIAEHTVVHADPGTTFRAARALDFLTVRTPLLSASMWIRGLPARWRGKPAPPPTRLVFAEGMALPGWLLLGEVRSRDRLRRSREILATGYRMA